MALHKSGSARNTRTFSSSSSPKKDLEFVESAMLSLDDAKVRASPVEDVGLLLTICWVDCRQEELKKGGQTG